MVYMVVYKYYFFAGVFLVCCTCVQFVFCFCFYVVDVFLRYSIPVSYNAGVLVRYS
jgi:hypothetical protein